MDHLAILDKKSKLLDKILNGEKTIESRWSIPKITPYQNISIRDVIYFKESGEKVKAKAEVKRTLFYEGLTIKKMKEILDDYGSKIGVDKSYLKFIRNKNYCTLIFLKNVQEIDHFNINKIGYGIGCAWITIDDINKIKCK